MNKPYKSFYVNVTAVVVKDNKILIGKRSLDEVQAAGMWALPGGKFEKSTETNEVGVLERTFIDEVMEETGISVDHSSIKYLKSGSFVRNDGQPVVVIVFIANWESGIAEPLDETIKVDWLDKSSIEKYEFANGVEDVIVDAFGAI